MESQSHPIRVLLVEADDDDYLLVSRSLSDIPAEKYMLARVIDCDAARDAIVQGDYDVCLLAYRAGGESHVKPVNEILLACPNIPIILLVNPGDHSIAPAVLNAGIADSLTKDEIGTKLLDRSIQLALERYAKWAQPKAQDKPVTRIGKQRRLFKAGKAMEDMDLLTRSTLNALSANMVILDEEGFILCTNQSWNVFAHSNGSIETSFDGANYLEVCDRAQGDWSEEASIAASGIREVIAGGRDGFELEYPCHSSDQKRWFRMRVTRCRDYERVLAVVSHENITEWKRAEAALRSQNARFRAVLDNMPAGVTFFEREAFRPILANRMGEELLGRSLPPAMAIDELESYFQAYRPGTDEPYPIHRLPFVRAMSGESCSADDLEIRSADGSRLRIEVFGAPVRDTSGSITGAVAIFHDITRRKRMEEVLQESEDRFRRAMEATNDGIWDWNVTNGKVYYSPGYFRMLGYEPGEFPAKADTWLELIHPDDRERAWAANDACIRNESPVVNVEFRMRSRDGSWRWILGRGVATLRDTDGQALQMIGTHMDITERKWAEERLRKSEERFQELAENIREVFWVTTCDEMLYISPACREIWGMSPESLHRDPSSFIALVHPEDRERVLKAHHADMEGVASFTEEYRILRPDGEVRWIWARTFPIREDGVLVRTVGIAEDITVRKEAEEFLRIERDLALGLGSAASFTEALELLLKACLKIDHFDCGGIYLVDRDAGALRLICHQGFSADFADQVSFYTLTSPLGRFATQGKPGYWSKPELVGILEVSCLFRQEGLTALASIPVNSDGEIVALLNVSSHTRGEIPLSIRAALESIAGHIGEIISRVRLGETIKTQSERLGETNAALRVLIRQREDDRAELEESLLSNVKHLVLPYLDKLKRGRLAEDQRHLFEILESHLRDITSPFVRKISAPMLGLTPTEIRVAELIRQGMSSKEIADLLATSESAVIFHRQGIRRKLGLVKKHINLRAYLATVFQL